MNFLEEKILSDGVIKEGNILKVDNFLNHQIDIDIMRQVAYEFKRRFRGKTVFAENCVAVVFVLAVILNLILPKEKENV